MHPLIEDHFPVTARHEAGHAVVYWWKGLTFRYVTIRSRYALGQVALWKPRRTRSWDMAAIAAAGPIAEHRYLGRQHDDERIIAGIEAELELAEGFGSDWCGDLLAFGRALPREEWVPTWRGTELMVTETLWPAVEAVAQALLASPRALRYSEVADIAESVMGEGMQVSR